VSATALATVASMTRPPSMLRGAMCGSGSATPSSGVDGERSGALTDMVRGDVAAPPDP